EDLHQPLKLEQFRAAAITNNDEPKCFKQASQDARWHEAMQKEVKALEKNGTWTLEYLWEGKRAIDLKWVYMIKFKPNGKDEKYKARLVAKGFNQIEGLDYHDTFAPVATLVTVCTLLAIVVKMDWIIHQLDVNNAFLHGDLDEEVIFMGRELVSVVDDVFLRMVNNLDAWNSFPWGKNPNHVPSYSLTGFLYAFKAPIELAPTKADIQSTWYTPSNDYFILYAPRSPPVSIGELYRQYLNKISATRTRKKKSSKEFHTSVCGREKGREASLIDRVHDLEGISETLLTLSKEVKSLRGRIFKKWLKFNSKSKLRG
nr:putative reverse transcriptase, RNA-dependent DNA polymerase [Tanacetum cinerariifolium]